MIKRGRPKKENSEKKSNTYLMRMTNAMSDKLDACCKWKGKTKAEVFEESLNMYYNLARHQHGNNEF